MKTKLKYYILISVVIKFVIVNNYNDYILQSNCNCFYCNYIAATNYSSRYDTSNSATFKSELYNIHSSFASQVIYVS